MTFYNTLYFLNDEVPNFLCFRFGPAIPSTHTNFFHTFLALSFLKHTNTITTLHPVNERKNGRSLQRGRPKEACLS